jgi:hypothetical protein
LRCRGCTTSPLRCPFLLSGYRASSSTGAVTAYRSITKNAISFYVVATVKPLYPFFSSFFSSLKSISIRTK